VTGFGFSDVDGLGVAIDRVDLAASVNRPDLENVTAVAPEPAAVQRIKTTLGYS
jgi:hypothetical protein